MNRRGFLRLAGGAAASSIVKPTYFFAPGCGWVNPKTMFAVVPRLSEPIIGTRCLTPEDIRAYVLGQEVLAAHEQLMFHRGLFEEKLWIVASSSSSPRSPLQ